jgi:DNA-binding transcriptional ArsR family regulator
MFIYQCMRMNLNHSIALYIDETMAVKVAELFATLADPSRVRIIAALTNGEMHVSALAAAVGISESAVSHHLRHLRQMRLVRTHKDGRYVFYMLDDSHVADLYRCGVEHVQHG